MGVCGCCDITWQRKIIDKDGNAWLFGIYPGCDDCCGPAGVGIQKLSPQDWHLWDVERIPDFNVSDCGTAFINVVSSTVVRQHLEKHLIGFSPENGTIDATDADLLSEEAFRNIQQVVIDTVKKERAFSP